MLLNVSCSDKKPPAIIRVRLGKQHVVLHTLLCYKILGLLYQELKEITIIFLFSYPRIIRGIINTDICVADVYRCFASIIPRFIWSFILSFIWSDLNSFAGCVLVYYFIHLSLNEASSSGIDKSKVKSAIIVSIVLHLSFKHIPSTVTV